MTWNSRINQFNVAHCQTLTLEAKKKKKNSPCYLERSRSQAKEKQVSWIFSHNSLHFFKVLHVSYLVLYAAHLSINCSML